MSKKPTQLDQELHLVESGWQERSGQWYHRTLCNGWPLEDAYRLQRGADRGARGPLFDDLRKWARAQEEEAAP